MKIQTTRKVISFEEKIKKKKQTRRTAIWEGTVCTMSKQLSLANEMLNGNTTLSVANPTDHFTRRKKSTISTDDRDHIFQFSH